MATQRYTWQKMDASLRDCFWIDILASGFLSALLVAGVTGTVFIKKISSADASQSSMQSNRIRISFGEARGAVWPSLAVLITDNFTQRE